MGICPFVYYFYDGYKTPEFTVFYKSGSQNYLKQRVGSRYIPRDSPAA